MKYEMKKLQSMDVEVLTRHNDDGSVTYIPMELENPEYQEYLASLDEASTL